MHNALRWQIESGKHVIQQPAGRFEHAHTDKQVRMHRNGGRAKQQGWDLARQGKYMQTGRQTQLMQRLIEAAIKNQSAQRGRQYESGNWFVEIGAECQQLQPRRVHRQFADRQIPVHSKGSIQSTRYYHTLQ